MNLTLEQIAKITGCELKGEAGIKPSAVCGLDQTVKDGISYLSKVEKPQELEKLDLAALIVPQDAKDMQLNFKGALLFAQQPEWAFTLLLKEVDTLNTDLNHTIHERAVISPKASIGKNVAIGANSVIEDGAAIGDNTIIYPNVYIGKNVKIGAQCIIYPNVTVREECILKNKVIIQAGAVIGSDGFGYIFHNNKHEKIPQIGNVIIEDDVEIGANTTIDRAKINSTVIGANTKIDNLVQIGHNVKIGMASIIISQVGIAGSTEIGNGVILAGQAGISGHLKIGDRATVGPQTGVIGNVEPGARLMGSPAKPYAEFMKSYAIMGKLPSIYKEFQAMRKKKAAGFWGRFKK